MCDTYNILTIKSEYEHKKIALRKPYKTASGIQVFDIVYDKKPLLIQTPTCIIPYSYNLFDNDAFKLDITTTCKKFVEMISNINKHILAKLDKYDNTILENRVCIDYLKYVNNSDEHRIRLKNCSTSNITAFDRDCNTINIRSLQTFDQVVCLFQLQRLIIQKDTYIFSTTLLQVKKLNISLSALPICLIKDNEDNLNYYKGIDLTKYNKMDSLGIPLVAIHQKMCLDALDKDCISYWTEHIRTRISKCKSTSLHPLPPPPPPPLPPSSFATSLKLKTFKPDFLKEISSNNIVLRKVGEQVSNKSQENFKHKFKNTVPTLGDILKAKSNLKKVVQ
jgi:hypothetical protein